MPKNNLDTLMIARKVKMNGATLNYMVFDTDPQRELYLNVVNVKNATNGGSIAMVGVDKGGYDHVFEERVLTTADVFYKFDIKQWLPAGEKIKVIITGGNVNDLIIVHVSGHYRGV